MKMKFLKLSAVVLVAVLCAGLFAACNDSNKDNNAETTVATTAAPVPDTTGPKVSFDDLLEGMSEAEISQVYQDLEDLGMTTDDLMGILYGDYDASKLTEEADQTAAE